MRTEILLFDGFDDLDAIGPLEVLHAAGFSNTLVSYPEPRNVTSAAGTIVAATAGISDAPQLLIVPGGGWLTRAPAGAWAQARRGALPSAIAERAAAGSIVASVCTGAMLLAQAGLLRNRPATTHHSAQDELPQAGARLIPGARVVDDGDILTSAGVTAGIDLALWLVERELGGDAARAQEQRLEYVRGRVWHR